MSKDYFDMSAAAIGLILIVMSILANEVFLLLIGVGIASMFFTSHENDRKIAMVLVMVIAIANLISPAMVKNGLTSGLSSLMNATNTIGGNISEIAYNASNETKGTQTQTRNTVQSSTSSCSNITHYKPLPNFQTGVENSVDGFETTNIEEYFGKTKIDQLNLSQYNMKYLTGKGLSSSVSSWCIKTIGYAKEYQGCGISNAVLKNCKLLAE